MIVTTEQQEQLKALIWANVKYRETYDEVYDHVLSAVEEQPEIQGSMYVHFNELIDNDFGGVSHLENLEADRMNIVTRQIRKKQRIYLAQYFRLPLLIFTLFLAGLTYYLTDHIPRLAIILAVVTVGLVPVMVVTVRGINNMYHRKTVKPSVKDKVVSQVGTFGMSIFNCIIFLPQLFMGDGYKVFRQAHVSVIALIMLFYIIYCLSFIKLYRDEFKMQLVF